MLADNIVTVYQRMPGVDGCWCCCRVRDVSALHETNKEAACPSLSSPTAIAQPVLMPSESSIKTINPTELRLFAMTFKINSQMRVAQWLCPLTPVPGNIGWIVTSFSDMHCYNISSILKDSDITALIRKIARSSSFHQHPYQQQISEFRKWIPKS